MRNILVPVDGSDSSVRAVKAAIQAMEDLKDCKLHVITVHPPIVSGNVTRFFSAEAINDYYQDEGRNALLPAKTVLDEAGVSYQDSVQVGPVAITIAKYAKDHGCDLIIMGTRGLGSVTGMVLGSIATKVLSLVDIPVTLIK
ncbi:universal stress protein [Alcaligenaceae bacterium]|nr:universal stress protein [Alcaligenaceae bacterium]